MGKWRKEKPRDPGAWGEERRWQTTLCKAPGGRPFSLGREDSVVHPSKAGIPPRRSRHSAKVVSWYIITFISKLCMKKNEKQQNFHLSSRVNPPILLPEDFAYIPCTPEDSFSQGLRPQEYLFCTQIKATSTLNNLWLNSFFCLRGGLQDNLCESGMADLLQSTESLEPLCAAWQTSAMVHVSGNLQHGTCFIPLVSTKPWV